MAKFGEFKYGEETYGAAGGGEIPADIFATRVPWIFRDYSLAQYYEMAINPVDASVPATSRSLTSKPTCAGQKVTFEGRPPVQTMDFSGTLLTETQHSIMMAWFREKKQVQITDDLGRKYWVLLTGFQPTRNYSPEYPWRHEYQATATVLDWSNT